MNPSGLLRVLVVALLPVALLPGAAHAAPPPGLTLDDAWIRALPGLPAAGYFSLHNAGLHAVTLTGADATACGTLTLHQTVRMRTMSHGGGMAPGGMAPGAMAGMPGMTSMHAVAAIEIPPGATVRFTPGGYHLMCEQPGPAVAPGRTVPVTLHFSDGSSLAAGFPVRSTHGS
ncbi:copper chaperone PCu(A)C [Lichenicoccus sp.]|uniref:copper chaperone PCu(A)C n=1 Tax=Lichenicoccus sp. TaxID=2781899 RepID=UPI003D0D852F